MAGNGDGRNFTAQLRRTERERVLQEALEVMDAACARNECERLVVVAPDRMLSAFRRRASDHVRARLWRECASEVTTLSVDDIAHAVDAYFGSPAG